MNNLLLDKQYRDKCRKNILSVIIINYLNL